MASVLLIESAATELLSNKQLEQMFQIFKTFNLHVSSYTNPAALAYVSKHKDTAYTQKPMWRKEHSSKGIFIQLAKVSLLPNSCLEI